MILRDFAQRLSHPSSKLLKEYIAAIDGVMNKRYLNAVGEGKVIDGVQCTPDSVELLPQQRDMKPRLRIVVHEGRNHEVRELVKNAGLEVCFYIVSLFTLFMSLMGQLVITRMNEVQNKDSRESKLSFIH